MAKQIPSTERAAVRLAMPPIYPDVLKHSVARQFLHPCLASQSLASQGACCLASQRLASQGACAGALCQAGALVHHHVWWIHVAWIQCKGSNSPKNCGSHRQAWAFVPHNLSLFTTSRRMRVMISRVWMKSQHTSIQDTQTAAVNAQAWCSLRYLHKTSASNEKPQVSKGREATVTGLSKLETWPGTVQLRLKNGNCQTSVNVVMVGSQKPVDWAQNSLWKPHRLILTGNSSY